MLILDVIAPSLDEQLKNEGHDINPLTVSYWQKAHDAINYLYITGYIPASQSDKSRDKLLKNIRKYIETHK